MNPYEGVTGSTDFDDNGDVRKFHTMYGIQEGAAVRLEKARSLHSFRTG